MAKGKRTCVTCGKRQSYRDMHLMYDSVRKRAVYVCPDDRLCKPPQIAKEKNPISISKRMRMVQAIAVRYVQKGVSV